jgi:hypothetical protein
MLFDAGLSAWATLALAVLALIAAIVAGCAWAVQARQLRVLRQVNAKQLPVLEGQRSELEASRELREREERDRRERFVSQVFCWQEVGPNPALVQAQIAAGVRPGMVSTTYLRNAGTVPVYDIAFSWSIGGRYRTWSQRATPLMPPAAEQRQGEAGEHWQQQVEPDWDPELIEIAVFLRDAAGNRWRLQPGGHYEEYADGMLPPGATWKTT